MTDNTISYTQLSTYVKCPLKHNFKYIQKIEKPGNINMIFGSAIHEALKYRNGEIIVCGTCDNHDALGVCTECWFRELERNEFEIDRYNDDYNCMIQLFEAYLERKDRPLIIDAEARKVLDLGRLTGGKLNYLLIGYIDGIISKVNGTAEIIEYKTSGRKWSATRPELELQPDIYGLLLGADHLTCNYDIMVKSVKPDFQWLPTVRDSRNFAQALKTIEKIINAIESGICYPVKSYLCSEKYCDYTQECKEW